MWCWGGTLHGELGLGGIEDDQILLPAASLWSEANKVIYVACGENHTLFLTEDGKIFSCGNNDFGQLGHSLPGKRPQFLSSLESYGIVSISCGSMHSLAVNEWGQIFSWGAGELGQLGLGVSMQSQPTPKIIRDLAVMQVSQIACGYYHSVALMNNGDMYSWGSNSNGQLGQGTSGSWEYSPVFINSVAGVPFSYIACGGYHTFAITKSGAVFGWGKNQQGQLGLNDKEDRCYPTLLKNFRSINICQVACGENFSVFLSFDGGVFACGANKYGQLGHGDNKDEWLPKKIVELMGVQVVQVACGRCHMVVATASGRLQACGLSTSGQLACFPPSNSQYISIPRVIDVPLQQFEEMSDGGMNTDSKIFRIFAGGDRCFATVSKSGDLFDSRIINNNIQILSISASGLEACKSLKEGEQVEQDILCYIETVFKSLPCVNASFLSPNHYYCRGKNSGVDVTQAENVFKLIHEIENTTIKDVIMHCIEILMKVLNPNPPDIEALRYFLSLPYYHEMLNPRHWPQLQAPLAVALANLKQPALKILQSWYHAAPRSYFERMIIVFKSVVSHFFAESRKFGDNRYFQSNFDIPILPIFKALERLNMINAANVYHKKAPPETFYIHDLGEYVDVKQDYINWLSSDDQSNRFFFCNYPFLFDALCKTSILELDQAIQMHAAMNQASTYALYTMLQGGQPPSQFLILNVSRDKIVEDTLRELSIHDTRELKKPLKVKFHGEEAEDGGGVRKEFFLLLLRDILDPKYGMFRYYSESRSIWFAEDSFEEATMFYLIGLICGLAIYNFTIISVNFPLALYKKLLKAPLTLEDLEDLDPILAKSLQDLLDYDGNDTEAIFGLYFEISREVYGSIKLHPLKEDGGKIPVTNENKSEFVSLYVDFIFNTSIESKFNAFYSGFYKVCGGRVFQLFQPKELMDLVIGNEEYNWNELESSASYRGGYNTSDPVIIAFWESFYELSQEDKKKFLLFLTGCDRVPIQGMKAIKITIQPTNDDKFLPVAHTCFNLLDLPKYSTKEKLKYKLLQAIQQKEGFSLV